MWKTPFLPTAAMLFSPQATVQKFRLFHSLFFAFFGGSFSTGYLSTFHSPCGKNYRQELIFAVMSRILFCRLVSPFFSSTSTLRMA